MANSKRSKHSSRDIPSVDRISDLSDCLLCHIISFLPTHYVVQTTILSKRWTNLWTSLTSLHFNIHLFNNDDNEKDSKRFEQFVNRVLALLKTPCLHKFDLNSISKPDSFHVNKWVSAALSRHVRELTIHVFPPEDLFHIPASLFTCKTLSYLSLSTYLMLDVPNSVCLPKLKYLSLSSVKYTNDESVRKLLSGCPVLEELLVQRLLWVEQMYQDNVVHFSISSPTLKYLDLYFLSASVPVHPRHTLEIDAPMLQYLHLYDQISSDYVIGNLSSVVKAQISIYDRDWINNEYVNSDKILKLLNRLSHVKFLKLSGATIKALSYAHELVPDLPNLSKLEGHFNTSKQELWNIHPEHVPKGWLAHLTTIEILHVGRSTNELMMVKFILKGAKSLEIMTICGRLPETKFYWLQEITKFPIGSGKCKVVVR